MKWCQPLGLLYSTWHYRLRTESTSIEEDMWLRRTTVFEVPCSSYHDSSKLSEITATCLPLRGPSDARCGRMDENHEGYHYIEVIINSFALQHYNAAVLKTISQLKRALFSQWCLILKIIFISKNCYDDILSWAWSQFSFMLSDFHPHIRFLKINACLVTYICAC